MEGPARMPRRPGAHRGVLVGGEVVEDGVHALVGRHLALNGVQEANDLRVAMALHAAPDHGSVEQVERREPGGGAVPDVIVRHRAASPRLERGLGLGAVERLDLRILVDRQHDRMGRRIEIEPDYVDQLVDEERIARTLEGRVARPTSRAPVTDGRPWWNREFGILRGSLTLRVDSFTPSDASSVTAVTCLAASCGPLPFAPWISRFR